MKPLISKRRGKLSMTAKMKTNMKEKRDFLKVCHLALRAQQTAT
jgi:hypothetical protein